MQAPLPNDEKERLATLRSYGILDTMPEQSYDDVVLLASQICDTPIAAISFIDEDRQWFKSIYGLDVNETPRDVAFCAHAILDVNEPLVVEDATLDARFSDNALVTGMPKIRFYAGTPLVVSDGRALGTLCVIDRTPKKLTAGQRQALVVLGRQVVFQLQLRRTIRDLQDMIVEVRDAQAEMARVRGEQDVLREQFFSHVSHELRSPLTTIYQFVTILLDGLGGTLNEQQREYLVTVLQNAEQLKHMIGDLLEITRARTGKMSVTLQRMKLEETVTEVVDALAVRAGDRKVSLRAESAGPLPEIAGDPVRLCQILTNLVGNALKFVPEGGSVVVRAQVDPAESSMVRVTVEDTGCGIEPEHAARVFDQLYQVPGASGESREGLGLGLHICKTLVERHAGKIWLESESGRGSRFHFTVQAFDAARPLMLAPPESEAPVEDAPRRKAA